MRAVTAIYLYEGEEKIFGEGPYRLLCGVREKGSLHAAALDMKMSYSKAFSVINRAERALGFPLTEKVIGGAGGGGSSLTAQAKEFMRKYEQYREACRDANRKIYDEIFAK